jgi:hypothetical protein
MLSLVLDNVGDASIGNSDGQDRISGRFTVNAGERALVADQGSICVR